MKLNIAVDIDGVLGDQVTPILLKINAEQGLNISKDDITRWNEPVGNNTIDIEIETALLNDDFILSMPLIEYSQEGMRNLGKHNHIIIATNRPKQTERATIKWLQSNFAFDEFYNTRHSGKNLIKADILIDDYINNILNFANSGRTGILFSQPWNYNSSCLDHLINQHRVYRCINWKSVVYTIMNIRK